MICCCFFLSSSSSTLQHHNVDSTFLIGSASLQGTLIVEVINISAEEHFRHVIGYVGNLTFPFDVVVVRSLERCIDLRGSSLDYRKEDLSMGLLLQMRSRCHGSRTWVVPLIIVGNERQCDTIYSICF